MIRRGSHHWPMWWTGATVLAWAALASWPARAADDAEGIEFFEKKIRPVLVDHCYKCHSHQSEKLRGGLHLDSRAAMLKGGEIGPAIVPGEPQKSLLIEAVRYGNVDLEMPPKGKLDDAVIADLAKWVSMGAPWPDEKGPAAGAREEFDIAKRKAEHWAWRPVADPVVPTVKHGEWVADPIDAFILAKLEAAGIAPAPRADRRVLVRRAYFALIGLPPTPEQVAAFVNDLSPDAWAKLIDRLLADPRFGERWARHWLDLVRYAETYGHEFDYPIEHAWRYRDYVIRAFNADVPYDRLVHEHIAGDLLPDPRMHPTEAYNESIIGTGFWHFGEATHAPVDVRGDEAGRVDNQIDVMTKTFMAMTVACARCHDHKFDAISTKDYYALCGYLQSSHRQEAMLDPHGRIGAVVDQMRQVKREAEAQFVAALPKDDAATGAELARYLLAAREAMTGEPTIEAAAAKHGVEPDRLHRLVKALEDESTRRFTHPMHAWSLLSGKHGEAEAAWQRGRTAILERFDELKRGAEEAAKRAPIIADFNVADYAGWRATGHAFDQAPVPPGVADSGTLSPKLRGVLRSPTFTITSPDLYYRVRASNAQIRLVIDGYIMDQFSALLFRGALMKVDTQGARQWVTQTGDINKYIGHRAHIELIDDGDGWIAVDEVRMGAGGPPPDAPNHVAADIASNERVNSIQSLAEAYAAALVEASRKRRQGDADADETALLDWAIESGWARLSATDEALKAHTAKLESLAAELPEPTRIVAMTDLSAENERVHIRGNHRSLGDVVPRRFLEAIDPRPVPDDEVGSGRLMLARQLTDPANPLTSRVMANRVWHHLMGRGIVPSVDNFGVLGQEPTHPELLDHLAARFVADGWSIKRLIRRVMLSSTYQMSSAPSEPGERLDPQNLLWHRMEVRRLEGEAIRDAMLAVSGRLDSTMFGPSVATHLTPFMEGRGRPGASGPLDGDGRRSIYLSIRRNFLSPMMLAFDTPSPFSTMGRRSSSNVPAQALILMNDPFVAQQAELWARRVLAELDRTIEQRIAGMYEAAFARPPTSDELTDALAFIDQQGEAFGIAPDRRANDAGLWADFAHVLFNVKQFIFVP